MKKLISTILLFSLCCTLCACSGVKQEVYDAAMSSYEAAKAGYEEASAKYDELKSKVDKYSTVIEALEKEDYDGAVKAVNAMRPAPEITEVEITMDNLWDYFEISENRQEQADAHGNVNDVNISYVLALKEDFKLADGEEYPTDVAVGYEYTMKTKAYWLPCTIDFDAWNCDGGSAWTRNDSHESKMAHFTTYPCFLYNVYAMYYKASYGASENDAAHISTVDDFEIVNASGTLYLVNK